MGEEWQGRTGGDNQLRSSVGMEMARDFLGAEKRTHRRGDVVLLCVYVSLCQAQFNLSHSIVYMAFYSSRPW
jgi:hypothetical protein